jgi:hypothetical protein
VELGEENENTQEMKQQLKQAQHVIGQFYQENRELRRQLVPSNISKIIPLSIKKTWVHYPNLCATEICYQTFFKG